MNEKLIIPFIQGKVNGNRGQERNQDQIIEKSSTAWCVCRTLELRRSISRIHALIQLWMFPMLNSNGWLCVHLIPQHVLMRCTQSTMYSPQLSDDVLHHACQIVTQNVMVLKKRFVLIAVLRASNLKVSQSNQG